MKKTTYNFNRRLPKVAYDIFVKRYSLKNDKGQFVETPEDIVERAINVVSQAENDYRDGVKVEAIKDGFRKIIFGQRFLPNGRTLANAGTQFGQLANCFVLPIEDELGKTEKGIFSTLRKAILILQTGGGVGFSFGHIRPKGDFISSSKGRATGAVSFLKIYDTAFDIIGQGGGRRSAAMAVLPVWHPDILEFISVKEKEGLIVNFNISVGITDEFMRAVRNDDWFELINPRDHKVWRRLKARTIFNQIVKNAYRNGEPGVLFLDRAERDNPIPNVYQLEATNPCGEQFLGPYENCCLGSINLRYHLKEEWSLSPNGKLKQGSVDWDKLAETVRLAVRFLDDVVDTNRYVPAVPEIEEAAKASRRIGLSVMGLADMMYRLGVGYGSPEGVELAAALTEFIRYQAMLASIELAKERGPFPLLKGSIFDPAIVGTNKRIGRAKGWQPKFDYQVKKDFGRPKLNWEKVVRGIRKYGIRNAALMTIAPTGAIATVSGLEGYGCEPVFALSYIMKTHEGAGDGYRQIHYESSLFNRALDRLVASGYKLDKKRIFDQVRTEGSCQHIEELPQVIRQIYRTSSDITAEEHVRTQAALQAFVDNSISKTINFPPQATTDDVAKAYRLGWRLGVKGMTVYVNGSRQEEVLTRKETPKIDFRPKTEEDDQFRLGQITKSKIAANICPECGAEMQVSEGCYTCPICGYSKCDS